MIQWAFNADWLLEVRIWAQHFLPGFGRNRAFSKPTVKLVLWCLDGGILFKGITFSGHFFEMIIHQSAAGEAGALSAERAIKVKWRSHSRLCLRNQCQRLASTVSPAPSLISALDKRSRHGGCHSDKETWSSKTCNGPLRHCGRERPRCFGVVVCLHRRYINAICKLSFSFAAGSAHQWWGGHSCV